MTDGSEMATASDPPPAPAIQKLPCIICRKSKIMTFDDIAKLCTDFNRENEIITNSDNSHEHADEAYALSKRSLQLATEGWQC